MEEMPSMYKSASHPGLLGICCGLLVKEDCRRDDDRGQLQVNDEEALFCTLCNAEVLLLLVTGFWVSSDEGFISQKR